MADRVRAAAVAQNTGHPDDQRGDQDDEPENDDHDSSETAFVSENIVNARPAESLKTPGAAGSSNQTLKHRQGESPRAGAPPGGSQRCANQPRRLDDLPLTRW
jgi:hypothetical protein